MGLNGDRPHVVIIGGGFGGLYCARALADAPVRITLLDRRNHHLFQPLLYQVATAALNAADIAQPIRAILRKQSNCEVLLAEATGHRRARPARPPRRRRRHRLRLPRRRHRRHPLLLRPRRVASSSPPASRPSRTRSRFASASSRRSRRPSASATAVTQRQWLTFVVVGGGATGVELAGALSEIALHALTRDFRRIDPRQARVLLLEGAPHVLVVVSRGAARQGAQAAGAARRGGRTSTRAVTGIDDHGVTVHFRSGEERIAARTVLWGAGVAASPLARSLGVPLDKAGRVLVDADLNAPGLPQRLRHRRSGRGQDRDGAARPRRGAGGDAGGQLRRAGDRRPRARQADLRPPVRVPRQGLAGHHRPQEGGRRSAGARPPLGLRRLAGLALHPHPLPHRLPQPRARAHRVGLAVPDLPRGARLITGPPVAHRAAHTEVRTTPGGDRDSSTISNLQ